MTDVSNNTEGRSTEMSLAMPTGSLLMAVIGLSSVIGICWPLVALSVGAADGVVLAGGAAALIVGVVSVSGILIMVPWRVRPVSAWTTMWLAATVMRLFLTPAATFLIYSTTSLNDVSFILAVAATYLATLLAEVVVIARHMNRRFTNVVSRS